MIQCKGCRRHFAKKWGLWFSKNLSRQVCLIYSIHTFTFVLILSIFLHIHAEVCELALLIYLPFVVFSDRHKKKKTTNSEKMLVHIGSVTEASDQLINNHITLLFSLCSCVCLWFAYDTRRHCICKKYCFLLAKSNAKLLHYSDLLNCSKAAASFCLSLPTWPANK